MSIYIISVSALISSIFVLGLGIFIFYKDHKSSLNIIFAIMSLAIGIWLFGTYNMLISQTDSNAIFWDRFIYAGVVFIPATMYHFGRAFTKLSKQKASIIIGYLLSFIFLLLSRTDLFVSGLFRYTWGVHTQARLFHHIFLLFFFLYLFLTLKNFYVYYRKVPLSGNKKMQAKYVFIAFSVLIPIGSTAYMPAYKIGIFPFSFFSGLIFSIIIAYAIVKHRLMDIKFVMRRYSVFLVSLSVVLILATAVKYIFDNLFSVYSAWVHLLILVAALFIFPPIKNRFYRLANKYFFSSLYDAGEVIAALSDKLRTTLETEKIYEYIFNTLTNAFHVKSFGILIYDEKNKLYAIRYNQGFKVGAQTGFAEDEVLDKMFIKQNKIIITEEIERAGLFEKNKTIDLLTGLKVEILAPLNIKDKTIGLIALGKKESGDMYNDEDLKVLEVTGAQAAIALENALLYKETKNFGVKMEKEVKRATRDLRKANAQLKKLDEAKSDFISIASHQLRTPLTVIKGYISMMLEGNFGQLTQPETESLEKVFISNERLIQLVENLLDISRIESGRMEFKFKPTDLNKMTESVVEELSVNAKKKELILDYKPPLKPLPLINLDEEKIRQVVMNLIDNAIKYTKQGAVNVTLESLKNSVKFSVADSGMGIRPEDMVNLFKKFSRGDGTSLIHTEGTGLGLYVARMMIEAHHGKVWAESDGVDKGSKFFFELPAG